nr:precusor of biologically active peptides MS9.2 [Metridium senile]
MKQSLILAVLCLALVFATIEAKPKADPNIIVGGCIKCHVKNASGRCVRIVGCGVDKVPDLFSDPNIIVGGCSKCHTEDSNGNCVRIAGCGVEP